MEDTAAKRAIEALAQGFDPSTGAQLAADSPLRDPAIVRALIAAVGALEARIAAGARRHRGPGNVGVPWTVDEEQALVAAWDSGVPATELATRHGRTLTGIEARLEKLGKLAPEQRVTRNRFNAAGAGSQ